MYFIICVVSEQLSAQHGAVKMLHSRVRLLLDYLKSIQSGGLVWYGVVRDESLSETRMYIIAGDLPANHEILREVSSLCDQLPVLDNRVFEKDFCSVSSHSWCMQFISAHVG